jgi:hypothetical protein
LIFGCVLNGCKDDDHFTAVASSAQVQFLRMNLRTASFMYCRLYPNNSPGQVTSDTLPVKTTLVAVESFADKRIDDVRLGDIPVIAIASYITIWPGADLRCLQSARPLNYTVE